MENRGFLSSKAGTDPDSSGNMLAVSDHPLTKRGDLDGRKLRRRAIAGPGNTWLTKRRDGASNRWMVAWYDPTVRTVRYRSTGKTKFAEAKEVLANFRLPENAVALAPIQRRGKSFVYFIGGETGAIKIGVARQPYRRLATLQSSSPIPLRILAMAMGGQKEERFFHERFAAHRLHGEWFTPAPEILTEIERLARPTSPQVPGRCTANLFRLDCQPSAAIRATR